MLDIENMGQAKAVGRAVVNEMIQEWIKIVEYETGMKPMLYVNDRFAKLISTSTTTPTIRYG